MDKQHKTLRQLTSLTRLRNLQKVQSAAALASANRVISEAETALHQAEARYHLAVELLRRKRAGGQAIDPVLYGLLLSGTDTVQQTLLTRQSAHEQAEIDQREAKSIFANRHAEHKLVAQAADETRLDIQRAHAAIEVVDAQDQALRVRQGGDA